MTFRNRGQLGTYGSADRDISGLRTDPLEKNIATAFTTVKQTRKRRSSENVKSLMAQSSNPFSQLQNLGEELLEDKSDNKEDQGSGDKHDGQERTNSDVGDEDLPVTEARPAKGRPPEDKNHTPDRGNTSKRRIWGSLIPIYWKVDTFSQLLIPDQQSERVDGDQTEKPQKEYEDAELPDSGEGTSSKDKLNSVTHGPHLQKTVEIQEQTRASLLHNDQRINFSEYTCPSSKQKTSNNQLERTWSQQCMEGGQSSNVDKEETD
ncbi:hypothetical protein R1sor_005038 [Riccia sorocarpa]|uniref:Uncharacterized protein n=1 Tax=Riccia sorocarpa TaxID=122646 RepID=A0ABD3HLC8_9MARC